MKVGLSWPGSEFTRPTKSVHDESRRTTCTMTPSSMPDKNRSTASWASIHDRSLPRMISDPGPNDGNEAHEENVGKRAVRNPVNGLQYEDVVPQVDRNASVTERKKQRQPGAVQATFARRATRSQGIGFMPYSRKVSRTNPAPAKLAM